MCDICGIFEERIRAMEKRLKNTPDLDMLEECKQNADKAAKNSSWLSSGCPRAELLREANLLGSEWGGAAR